MRVTAVNHKRRIAIFDDNEIGEIVLWWTPGGQEHEDPPANPSSCMVQHPSGERVSIDLTQFDRVTRH